jgi:hypothetical protein
MTPEQIRATRKRLSLGSEGAWVKTGDWVRADGVPVVECIHGNGEQAEADADLIAHAPTDLRALLDEVERLTAERDKAFALGVRAMRHAAADAVDCPAPECACEGHPHALAIRALTDPEYQP